MLGFEKNVNTNYMLEEKVKYCDLRAMTQKYPFSKYTFRKFAGEGMPHFRRGNRIYVCPEDFEAWFSVNHSVRSSVELDDFDDLF